MRMEGVDLIKPVLVALEKEVESTNGTIGLYICLEKLASNAAEFPKQEREVVDEEVEEIINLLSLAQEREENREDDEEGEGALVAGDALDAWMALRGHQSRKNVEAAAAKMSVADARSKALNRLDEAIIKTKMAKATKPGVTSSGLEQDEAMIKSKARGGVARSRNQASLPLVPRKTWHRAKSPRT